jgi:hypothetical protein
MFARCKPHAGWSGVNSEVGVAGTLATNVATVRRPLIVLVLLSLLLPPLLLMRPYSTPIHSSSQVVRVEALASQAGPVEIAALSQPAQQSLEQQKAAQAARQGPQDAAARRAQNARWV